MTTRPRLSSVLRLLGLVAIAAMPMPTPRTDHPPEEPLMPKTASPVKAQLQLQTLESREVPAAPLALGDGLSAIYFDSATLDDAKNFRGPSVTRVDTGVNFDWGTGAPAGVLRADTFAARFGGRVEAPATGNYVFRTYSDDGVRLWIDDKLVIDQWNDHSARYDIAPEVRLEQGRKYHIVLEYYENGGDATVKLEWDRPDVTGATFQAIPTPYLYSDTRGYAPEQFARVARNPDDKNRLDAVTPGIVNVKAFGAKGDGITDDWWAIQQAVHAVGGNNDEHSVVYFPNGTYRVSKGIEFRSYNPDKTVDAKVWGGWRAYITFQGQQRDNVVIKLDDGKFTTDPSYGELTEEYYRRLALPEGNPDRLEDSNRRLPAPEFFSKPFAPNAVIYTASHDHSDLNWYSDITGDGNLAFENTLRDLTVHTGKNNPGAVGVDYQVSNSGQIRNIRVVSGDGKGYAGIRSERRDSGPGMIKDVTVDGFGSGFTGGGYNLTLEDIRLWNQSAYGLYVSGDTMSVRGLRTSQPAGVPGVRVDSRNTHLTLVDADLRGAGGQAAIEFEVGGRHLFRNVSTAGYKSAASSFEYVYDAEWNRVEFLGYTLTSAENNTTAVDVVESVPGGVESSFTGGPRTSLNLPVEETPEYTNNTYSQWAVIGPSTGGDDYARIQAALKSGKPVVAFTPGQTYYTSRPLVVPATVRKIVGLEATVRGLVDAELAARLESGESLAKLKAEPGYARKATAFLDAAKPLPVLRIDGAGNPLIVEGLTATADRSAAGAYGIGHVGARPLALVQQSTFGGARGGYLAGPQAGKFYAEDLLAVGMRFRPGQKVWIRQWNPEWTAEDGSASIVNNGADVWILGIKEENQFTLVENRGGGRVELLGVNLYPNGATTNVPAFINDRSQFSVSYRTIGHNGGSYDPYIREIQDLNGDGTPETYDYGNGYIGLYRSAPGGVAPAEGVTRRLMVDNFQDGDSTGWQTAGAWQVGVINNGQQKEYVKTGTGEGTAIAGSATWSNYGIDVSVKLEDLANGTVSLLGRVQDATHYYQLELKADAGGKPRWGLWLRDGDDWTELASGELTYEANRWTRLGLWFNGDAITVAASAPNDATGKWDGFAELGTVTNKRYAQGKVGLRATGTVASFDDLLVTPS